MKIMTKVAAGIIAISMLAVDSAFAASQSTAAIPTSAQVQSVLSIAVQFKKNSSTGANMASVDFGTLKDDGTNTLRSSINGSTGLGDAVAMATAVSSGLPYAITQTATSLTSGANKIPDGSWVVVPVLAPQDNNNQPNVGVLGAKGTCVAVGKTLYTSDAIGSIRTIQCHYSISDDGPATGATTAVPLSQPAGVYNGTITFTVTA